MKEEISSKQAVALVAAFILDGALTLPTAVEAGKNNWISIIIALIFSCVLFVLYYKIQLLYPGKNLYTINQEAVGKILGNLINLIYVWFFLHLGALTLRDFGEFMSVMTLPETPKVIIATVSLLTAVYMVKKGREVIAKFALFAGISTLLIMVVLFALLLPKIEIENILPLMSQGIKPVLMGAWSAFTFPFGECILFITVFYEITNTKTLKKGYFIGLAFGGIILLINGFLEISILGEKVVSILYFPFYTMLSRIHIGEFIQRLEVIGGIILNIFGMIKISLCLYAASLGISQIFKINDYKLLSLPIGLLMLNLTTIIYKDIMGLISWTAKYFKYYALPFEIFFPVLIIIAGKLRNKGDV